jgi:flagellin-like protein
MKSKVKGKDKGVSEVVGYILTFSIVIVAVTLIYTSGMPMVEQTSETAALQSMETSFVSLQSNVKKVALDQSPVRTVKFNLVKGSIGAKKSPKAGWLNITVDGTEHHNQSFGNIEYTIGTKKVIYENGAVIESTTGGNIIVSDPPIYFTNYGGNKNVFISVINVSGNFSAGGGIAEMHLRHDNTTVIYANENVALDSVTIASDYEEAWKRYINETFGSYPVTIPSCNLTLVTHNVSI